VGRRFGGSEQGSGRGGTVLRRIIIPLTMLAISLAVVACSDGGSDAPAADTSATPLALPTVEGADVRFPAKGYSARIPDGWSFDANTVNAPNITLDSFLAPAVEGETVQPSIAVGCEYTSAGELPDLETFAAAKIDTVTQLRAQNLTQESIEVAGLPATVIFYELERESALLKRSEVLLVSTGRCAFSLAFSVAPDDSAAFDPVFDQFLEDFEVVDEG
jgi:hypothetical protein